MTVTVVLPTHDRRRRLRRALASVIGQTRPADEIIVVDDGSSDLSGAMVRREYPGAVLIEQPNRGVSAARNRGIERARGEWLAFLDSDDEWLPTKLERQLAALERHPDARICHSDEIWIRNGRRVNPRRKHAKHGGRIFARCLPLCCISPSSVVVHRDVFAAVGLFDEDLPACEDYDMWLRVTARYPVLLVDEPLLIKHGGHADQLSRRHWGMDRFRIAALEKALADDRLSPAQRAAAKRTLADKIEIFRKGAARRGRRAESRRYLAKLQRLRRRDPAARAPGRR